MYVIFTRMCKMFTRVGREEANIIDGSMRDHRTSLQDTSTHKAKDVP